MTDLSTVREHLFELEDPITRSEEVAHALRALADTKDPTAYRAAINIFVDVLNEQMKAARAHWRAARDAAQAEQEPKLEAAKE